MGVGARTVSEAMREEILSQPAALRSLLARADEIPASMARIAGDAKRLWAVGHGDSYFAPLAAADAFRRWTTAPYAPLLAQEMAAYPPPGLDKHALVIALSMSGSTNRSIAAAQAAHARGARVLAITNTPGSPLARAADEVILLQIAEPAAFLAGTVTYTASVLALMMVAVVLTGLGAVRVSGPGAARLHNPAPAMADLARTVDALEVTPAHEPTIRTSIPGHAHAPIWYFLGMGCQEATARYAAAKMVEVADIVGIAHETEEFFHEHHWVVRGEHPVVLIAHDAPSRQRAEAGAAYLRELEIPVWLVGGTPVESVQHLPIGSVEPWASSLVAAVPLQRLAQLASRGGGVEPEGRRHFEGRPPVIPSRERLEDGPTRAG